MAGPLNLDNYSIEADESADELVITHVPTGKTTTLSEDGFSTGQLSVTNGAYTDTRKFLTYIEDTDTSTALSLDTGALANWPIYLVFGYSKLAPGVSGEWLTGTINNDTTANYQFTSSDGTTTGASTWDLSKVSEYRQTPFWLRVYAGREGVTSSDLRPGFDLKNMNFLSYADGGSFASDSATADSIQFQTSGAATMKARIMGADPF